MSYRIRLSLLFILFLSISIVLNAQNQEILEGKIIDKKNKKAIEFASIALLNKADSSLIAGAVSADDGHYKIKYTKQNQKNLLLRVSLVSYKTKVIEAKNNQIIELEEDSHSLDEVVVKAKRKVYDFNEGNIVANVSGTVLEKQPNVMMMLSRIPGISVNGNSISSFVGGSPIIYINGRKVEDIEELKQLDVKNIKNVELDTSPDARYDSSASSILLISTHNILEGLSTLINNDFAYTPNINNKKDWQNYTSLKLNYRDGGLSLNAYITAGPSTKFDSNENIYKIAEENKSLNDSDKWIYNNINHSNTSMMSVPFRLSMNYKIDKTKEFGISYFLMLNRNKNETYSPSKFRKEASLINENLESNSNYKNDIQFHRLYSFYNQSFSNGNRFEFISSAMIRQNNKTQIINSQDWNGKDNISQLSSKSNGYYIGLESKYTFFLNKNNSLSSGLIYRLSKSNNLSDYSADNLYDIDQSILEQRGEFYTTYIWKPIKELSISAGARLEAIWDKTKDNISQKYRRDYIEWLLAPTLSANYRLGEWSHKLTYRSRSRRPRMGQISSSSSFINQFIRSTYSPDLDRMTSHNIQYNIGYKTAFLSLSYRYVNKDVINKYNVDYSIDTNTSLQTAPKILGIWENFDYSENYKASLNLSHRFDFYQANMNIGAGLDRYQANNYSISSPQFIFAINNSFSFDYDIFASLNYRYNSKSNNGFIKNSEKHDLSLDISKSFIDNTILINFSVYNILNWKTKSFYLDDSLDYSKYNQGNSRSFNINLSWRFNKYKEDNGRDRYSDDDMMGI